MYYHDGEYEKGLDGKRHKVDDEPEGGVVFEGAIETHVPGEECNGREDEEEYDPHHEGKDATEGRS